MGILNPHPTPIMARILLIDDDYCVRTALRLTLAKLGHTVIEAGDGVEGLKRFLSANPDLVITDIVMPEKEGLEVIMAIRAMQPSVKVIAISGNSRLRAADKLKMARQLGAVSVLEKPFTPAELQSAVDAVLLGDVHKSALAHENQRSPTLAASSNFIPESTTEQSNQ